MLQPSPKYEFSQVRNLFLLKTSLFDSLLYGESRVEPDQVRALH